MKEQGRLLLTGKELIEDRFVAFPWFWRKQIVEPFSGARYFGEPFKVPGSDHFSIAKIEDADTIQHCILRRFILDWRRSFTRDNRAIPGFTGQALAPIDAGQVVARDGSTGRNSRYESCSSELVAVDVEATIVINLAVGFGSGNLPPLDHLNEVIKAIVGSPNLRMVEAGVGSFLMFVSDPDGALLRADLRELRQQLLHRENVALIGLTSLASYEARTEHIRTLDAISADLLSWPTSLPNGKTLERPELARLHSRIDDNVSSTTAVIGAAGAGKSALLATLAKSYRDAGWPVLAIKADLLDADVATEETLRERLGLDQRPAEVVRELSKFAPVLLIIDQLDALASYLDVRTARLSVMLNLVRKLGGIENIHVLVSSRAFEFQHDVRLRSVDAESLTLELPPWNEVLAILEANGIAAAGWPADAREVMRSPQSLAIYVKLSSRHKSQPFGSYQLMLDRLWEERVLIDSHGGELDQLASQIAETMAEQESLWLAASRFADRAKEMQALTAKGILTTLDASVGFSHQTLFEFTLARSFAREPGRLSSFTIQRQSSLFLRPKLWAGLTYLRGADRDLYHQELETIWRTENLRAHLRVLLIDFLGSQPEPSDQEALLMETALTGDSTGLRAFKALSGSRGWFDRFADSYIAGGMRSVGQLANAQIDVLTRAQPDAPEKVAELIRTHWLQEPANDLRTWSVIQWTSAWTEEALAITLTVIGRTDIASSIIDHQTGAIGVEQPTIALRLVRARLDRELDVAVGKAKEFAAAALPQSADATLGEQLIGRLDRLNRNPIRNLIEQNGEWDSLFGIAEKWPQETLAGLWPWFIRALNALDQLTDRGSHVGYPLSFEADFRFDDEKDQQLPQGSILGAVRIAVEGLADAYPDAFREWIGEIEGIALTPVQRLIAHGIAHRPEAFAEVGLHFVLGDERRYFLGSLHDMRATIKRMVRAISPHWTSNQVQRFEERVRAFAPPPADKTNAKDRMQWRHMMRRTQLDLLRALPGYQRSTEAARQVIEDERRYGSERRGVSFSGAQIIGSIIEADEMAKASDDDIVNAFVELPDATGWDNPRRWMAGGNIQLARAFATFAKGHSERSVRILARLDRDNGARAAAYTIDSLSEAAPPSIVFNLLRDVVARGFGGEEFRHSVAGALERMARRKVDIGEDLLTLLERWVDQPGSEQPDGTETEAPDASDASDAEENAEKGEEALITRSLLWGHGGFDAFPGGTVPIVDALVHIWLLRHEPNTALNVMSKYLVREKSIKAWDVLAQYLPHLGKADADKRQAILDKLLTEVQGSVGSKHFAGFLAGAQQQDHPLVERHLGAWKDHSLRATRQAYGEIIGLDSLLHPEHDASHRRLEEIVMDPAAQPAQVGAALSAAHIFAEEPDRRAEAAKLLTELLALPNTDVWTAAFELFRLTDELVPDEATAAVLMAVANGLPRSPKLNPTFVVERLATLLPHQAALVGEIALGLVAKWSAELADIRTSTAVATSALIDLAITLHRLGPKTRETGLTLFEQLIEIDAYEARRTLDEIDNRFRPNAPTARPRVRRGSQIAPRQPKRRGSGTV